MGNGGHEFTTVFGRGLVEEIPSIAHRPFLVVSMPDLWPRFEAQLAPHLAGVHLVDTLDVGELEASLSSIPESASVIGLGGGQAIDVAKWIAWRRRLPLFQIPTSMAVNAPFGHRAGLRVDGIVRYLGWAVPEGVYVDFDVIRSAPSRINRAGVGDILCYHTAHADWRLAHEMGRTEPRWPYDESLVGEARQRFDLVRDNLDAIREVTDDGIRALMSAHRWGGAAFHAAGWNPRHIEGVEHFIFYALERLTGQHFIHGQPVGLGIYIGSLMHEQAADDMLAALLRAGVDIRPEAMGIGWDDVEQVIDSLPAFVREAGLWSSIADLRPPDPRLPQRVHDGVSSAYGPWKGTR